MSANPTKDRIVAQINAVAAGADEGGPMGELQPLFEVAAAFGMVDKLTAFLPDDEAELCALLRETSGFLEGLCGLPAPELEGLEAPPANGSAPSSPAAAPAP